jgi:hypothetical protein
MLWAQWKLRQTHNYHTIGAATNSGDDTKVTATAMDISAKGGEAL